MVNCKKCGAEMKPENRRKQYERVKKGISELLGGLDKETLDTYTRNYLGYGPNYMVECHDCGALRKIIPDGRKRE